MPPKNPSDIDFHRDVEIECLVRGIDLGNASHSHQAAALFAMFKAEAEHRSDRTETWRKIRAVEAAANWLAAHPTPTLEDCLRLFSDPDVRLGFEMVAGAFAARRESP